MRLRPVALVVVLAVFGGVAGYVGATVIRARGPAAASTVATTVLARRELVLVYIGASTCGPSNDPRLPAWIREAADTLRNRARILDASSVTVGVARETDVGTGISHLRRTAAFDEISVGQRERNHLSLKYIEREFPGIAATPQVLVLVREYDELPLGGIHPGSARETLLLRRVGLQEIESWLRLGTPVPTSTAGPHPTQGRAVPF